ncbi:hypothetical protein MNBD_GAMMA07-973 [hydrothermal vent metagenome]|uniref:Polysaccharide chain length determinant N-terminal domain-containing protein n=1 Tax=hydrothermal vent metagenome TaxID=652676 RepID=A0A3B0XMR5_9ZZZZ
MKNKDLPEVKPIYIHEANYSADDEISLIDLVLVLVKRVKLISAIIIIFILFAFISTQLVTKQYTYSTSLEIGNQMINGAIKSFESPQTLLAKLQHSFIPQVLNEQYKTNPSSDKQYKIEANIPKGSAIIVLEIKGPAEQRDVMTGLLLKTFKKVRLDHGRIYNSVKQLLSANLKQAKAELTLLKTDTNNVTEITTKQNLIESYSSRLASLRNTREISPPMQSLSPKGVGKALIFIITVLAGIFIAIFAAFFAEFVTKVREEQLNRKPL